MFSFFFQRSIRRFIVLWGGLAIGICLVLAGVFLYVTARLELHTKQLISDARADDSALLLRNAVLEERQTELFSRLTGNTRLEMEQREALQSAGRILTNMDLAASTPAEEQLIDQIEEKFRDFERVLSIRPPVSSDSLSSVTGELISAIDRFRDANNAQMTAHIQRHDALLEIMDRWMVFLIVLVAVAVVASFLALTRRVVRPARELNDTAARFRRGDFSARTPVFYDDELGALARTFNDMAEDIGQREKSRHEFIASLFHDIRNPLVNLGGIARMLIRKPSPPETARPWLERMLREVGRIEDLAQDLTDTVQVETGHLTLTMAEVDFAKLVERVHAEHLETVTRHRLVYEHSGTCTVLGDSRRLERVAANLISNAVKYSPEGTTITLRVERRDGQVVFSVTDEGVGISPEDQQAVFLPFGRLSRTEGMAHGTGLGLAIVKRIVEAHGGNIRLTSGLDAGTMIEISFPAI